MSGFGVLNWFGRSPHVPLASVTPPSPVDDAVPPVPDAPVESPPWSLDRISIYDRLWGDGFLCPGGEEEALRFARPLGLSASSNLLLLGVGSGGPACAIAAELGVWVNGFEADPELAAAAATRASRSRFRRNIQIDTWSPTAPIFAPRRYHHALGLEPLRGVQPERVLAAVAQALKPSGQLALVEMVADAPLDPQERNVAAWARLERRDPTCLHSQTTITRVLGRLGFDVRIVEDISERHTQQTLLGWRRIVRGMEVDRPEPREARLFVREAEVWLRRMRLFRGHGVRMVRWHAISRGG